MNVFKNSKLFRPFQLKSIKLDKNEIMGCCGSMVNLWSDRSRYNDLESLNKSDDFKKGTILSSKDSDVEIIKVKTTMPLLKEINFMDANEDFSSSEQDGTDENIDHLLDLSTDQAEEDDN